MNMLSHDSDVIRAEPELKSVWELSYERKKRALGTVNHYMVAVVAVTLEEAVQKAGKVLGETHTLWSAKHLGKRVVIE